MAGAAATSTWRPTGALVRAVLAGSLLALVGVLLSRPALVVVAAPLLVAALVALLRRPADAPLLLTHVGDRMLPEGSGTTLRAVVTGLELEQATRVVAPTSFTATHPVAGAVSSSATGRRDRVEVGVEVSPRRWGRREVGGGLVAVTSTWGGYRWGPAQVVGTPLTALPAPLPFDSHAETPRPTGLVGANRASRDGQGTEFSGIREFATGDRLRRIHWRTSLRTGRLHTVTTTAEQDSEVLLVVDALADLGDSGGVDGAASSLDTTVRAAAALAEHHLRLGNRVGVRVVGGSAQVLRPAAGLRHQRRVLETLARVAPAPWDVAGTRLRLGAGAGTTVLALSPLLSPLVTTTLVDLAGRGLAVIAIDTLPDRALPPTAETAAAALAWRLRLVERRLELVQLARAGIPVVVWHGPGTLDEVMRRLARRSQLPRAVAR